MCLLLSGTFVFAQSSAPDNWFNLDASSDKVSGVSVERTYKELLKGRTSSTVVVAVIDSGVDYKHEDLKDVMWVNPGEIAGNGIDDDKNGYIDDIHGWNFIGGKNGKNIDADALEITRLTAMYHKKYKDVDRNSLSKKEKKAYDKYINMKKEIDDKQAKLAEQSAIWFMLDEQVPAIMKLAGKDNPTNEEIKAIETDDEAVTEAIGLLDKIFFARGGTMEDATGQIKGAKDYFGNQIDKWYNIDFDPRARIVGDNYTDSNQRIYGNNDVKGPDSSHGTHVAGIIGAVRDNDLGIKGVADNVRIMSIRTVPDGDERDKDVANAIFYAVDNGASIINMSFGKGYSYDKAIVDKAVKYAKKNDVLLIHAAGNDASNNDNTNNFPNDKYAKKGWFKPKTAKNWLEIGALSWKGGEDAVATFSNYGKANVDIFAPGHDIMSTTPEQNYAAYSGTSMAAPVAAGVAAMLRSYYPSLTACQVKDIIMESATPQTQKVKMPGSEDLVSFSELSKTGGVVNAYKAVQLANKTKGKKKIKKMKVVTP